MPRHVPEFDRIDCRVKFTMIEYRQGGIKWYQCSMPEIKEFVDIVVQERDFVVQDICKFKPSI